MAIPLALLGLSEGFAGPLLLLPFVSSLELLLSCCCCCEEGRLISSALLGMVRVGEGMGEEAIASLLVTKEVEACLSSSSCRRGLVVGMERGSRLKT